MPAGGLDHGVLGHDQGHPVLWEGEEQRLLHSSALRRVASHQGVRGTGLGHVTHLSIDSADGNTAILKLACGVFVEYL